MVDVALDTRSDLMVKPKTHVKGRGPAKSIIGPLTLPRGDYALRFGKHSGFMEATFSLKKVVRVKPHENLYEFGLTLLQIGVPIFITGVISLGFGTFVS